MADDDLLNLIAFEDEVQIVDWHDSPRGAKVTFLLPAEYAAHPFKTFRDGTRFFARFIELDDQDNPVDQAKRDEVARMMDRREGRGGRLSKEAAMLCKNIRFHEYIRHTLFSLSGEEKTELSMTFPHSVVKLLKEKGPAAFDEPQSAEMISVYYLYSICEIKSRRELDQATASGRTPARVTKYHSLIVEPFYKWRTGDNG